MKYIVNGQGSRAPRNSIYDSGVPGGGGNGGNEMVPWLRDFE